MDGSTPGFSVHHQLPELAQTHVHRIGDAIQPSHPLSSPSPPACVWDTEIFKKRSSRCCPPETYTLWENRPKNIVLFVGCHLYQISSTRHSGWTISWKCWLLTNACLSVQLFATPWILACQASLPMEFSRQEYWSGKPFPSPGESFQPRDQTWVFHTADRFFTIWATREAQTPLWLCLWLGQNCPVNWGCAAFFALVIKMGEGTVSACYP